MSDQPFMIFPGRLGLNDLRAIWENHRSIEIEHSAWSRIEIAQRTVMEILESGQTVYGINTGFGVLAKTRIETDKLEALQRNLVLSHSTGVGADLDDAMVRLILVLKIASLSQGHSGVKAATVKALLTLLENQAYPCIPCQGSVGASGDLAPLAHMSAALLGEGFIRLRGERMPAVDALQRIGLQPLNLGPKEGLALLNGTQVSCALALVGLFRAENVFAAALCAGAMSVDAVKASDTPFDEGIHRLRRQPGQISVARVLRGMMSGSEIRASHADCHRVQDPYCLRCQPQVMGACLDMLQDAARRLLVEANAVTDNPLVFPEQKVVLSGGNFHAEPVAFAADMIALALAEIGNMSERRVAMLVDPHMSGLPAFLVDDSGVNSGFMIAHVTAAALASENKTRAVPASVDTIPTSANQEDHVSMAAHGARRLGDMADNAGHIVAIEALAAAQGIEFHRPDRSSPIVESIVEDLRSRVDRYERDRFFAPDIARASEWVFSRGPMQSTEILFPSFGSGE